jgi:hypothetical protein
VQTYWGFFFFFFTLLLCYETVKSGLCLEIILLDTGQGTDSLEGFYGFSQSYHVNSVIVSAN